MYGLISETLGIEQLSMQTYSSNLLRRVVLTLRLKPRITVAVLCNLEGDLVNILLDLCVSELTSDETLGGEKGVLGVDDSLTLGGETNELEIDKYGQ